MTSEVDFTVGLITGTRCVDALVPAPVTTLRRVRTARLYAFVVTKTKSAMPARGIKHSPTGILTGLTAATVIKNPGANGYGIRPNSRFHVAMLPNDEKKVNISPTFWMPRLTTIDIPKTANKYPSIDPMRAML